MSHHTEFASTKLKKANKTLLKEAMKIIAKQTGGECGETVYDYRNANPKKVDISLTTPDLPRGIGVNVAADGSVKIAGDPYGEEPLWKDLESRINKVYIALSHAAAYRMKGYNVTIKPNPNNSEDLDVEAEKI